VVLLVAPQRSGSTLLFDLLRTHPAALFLPVADIYRDLGVRGRRYPMHLSNGSGPTIDIESQEGLGASVPALDAGASAVTPKTRSAIEKVHPSAARFDAQALLERVDRMKREHGRETRIVYLTRDPIDSVRSFLAYQRREPEWHKDAPAVAAPDFYLRSLEVMGELAAERPGPVVRYEELVADPTAVLAPLYHWLWPDIDATTNQSIAARATEITSRETRRQSQTGKFIGRVDRDVPTDTGVMLGEGDSENPERGRRAIDECRRLHAKILSLGVELPAGSSATRSKRAPAKTRRSAPTAKSPRRRTK